MRRVLRSLRGKLLRIGRLMREDYAGQRDPVWKTAAVTAALFVDLDPSQGVRHVARWDRIAGG